MVAFCQKSSNDSSSLNIWSLRQPIIIRVGCWLVLRILNKKNYMRKMPFILIMLLISMSAFATTTTATPTKLVDNKASPPTVTTQTTTPEFEATMPMPAETSNVYTTTPVLASFEQYNCNVRAGLKEVKAFLGPGDSLASGMLAGQQLQSNNDTITFTMYVAEATQKDYFLGPGDRLVSGCLSGQNHEETCFITTQLEKSMGPGDRHAWRFGFYRLSG